jgi:Protein of unknown function (DUF2934)
MALAHDLGLLLLFPPRGRRSIGSSKTSQENTMATMPDDDAVRSLAYELWEKRGASAGSAQSDWLRAEQTLKNASLQKLADQAVKDSFPASDPPASHLPDEPPVNADAKWAAANAAERSSAPRTEPGKATPLRAAAPVQKKTR